MRPTPLAAWASPSIQLGEWPLAEVALTQAVNRDGGYADAFAYLGLAQDMQAKDGLPTYEQALVLAPEFAAGAVLDGAALAPRWATPNSALPYLKTAQALDPQNPAVAAEIGGAYAALGDLTSAEIWFAEAVRKDEQNPAFWLLLARFYVDNEYHMEELGLPAARMAVGLNPESALAADALGYALVLTGDLANAEKMLLRALELDNASAERLLPPGAAVCTSKAALPTPPLCLTIPWRSTPTASTAGWR